MKNKYLTDVLPELELITKKVQAEFKDLTAAQLNWKPTDTTWSIGQCLDHLIKTNHQYFPMLEAVSQGQKKKTIWERLPGLPSFWGRMLLKSTHPASTKQYKAPAIFKPVTNTIPATIVPEFAKHQQALSRLISNTDLVPHHKTIVSSPVSPIITYSLHDCINIIMLHEERHFMQAKRLLKAENFPGKAITV